MPDLFVIVIVSTGLVLVLSGIVLLARGVLMPRGDAMLTINDRQQLKIARGERLLWVLAQHGILLPAACGGRGSCGQCRLRVLDGGGSILPVESALINRRQAAAGERLACMVTVRRDLSVAVPDSALDAQRFECTVESNVSITTLLRQITLRLPPDAEFRFDAGDYLLISAPTGTTHFRDFTIGADFRAEWDRLELERLSVTRSRDEVRAYSIASAPSDSGRLEIVVRIALPPAGAAKRTPPGQVSSYLFGLPPGSPLRVSGPYGDFHVRKSEADMVFVGGGAGIAPLRAMITDQLENRHTTRRISLWYGARNTTEVCFRQEFDELARRHRNFTWHVVFSDPHLPPSSEGHRGFVHAVLRDECIAAHPAPEEMDYYLCGPPLMSSAVTTMLDDFGVPQANIFYDDFGS